MFARTRSDRNPTFYNFNQDLRSLRGDKCLSHLDKEFRCDGVVPEGQPQSQHDGEDPPLLVSRDVTPIVRDLCGERHVDVDSFPVQQLVVGAQSSHLDLGGEGVPVVDDTCQDVLIQVALQLLQHALDGPSQHHAGGSALRGDGEKKVSIRCSVLTSSTKHNRRQLRVQKRRTDCIWLISFLKTGGKRPVLKENVSDGR
jgi:hypothetical protein